MAGLGREILMNRLSEYLGKARRQASLSPQALGGLLGYRNRDKVANRIMRFERGGEIDEALLVKIIAALALDIDTCRRLHDRDWAELEDAFERWVRVPVGPRLVFVPFPGVCVKHPILPKVRASKETAVAYAIEQVLEKRGRAILVWNRRWSLYIRRDGTNYWSEARPGDALGPYSTLGGQKVRLVFE